MAEIKLTARDIMILDGRATIHGIKAFFIAMYPMAVRILNDSPAEMVKIRLADRHNNEIWDACARDWYGKIVYSTPNLAEREFGRFLPNG